MDNPLVQPDPGLFIWTIVVFLVLLALLAKFAWRPLLEALDSREATIKKALISPLRERYSIDAVPMIVVADDQGITRASFIGVPTAADLWAALAELRT